MFGLVGFAVFLFVLRWPSLIFIACWRVFVVWFWCDFLDCSLRFVVFLLVGFVVVSLICHSVWLRFCWLTLPCFVGFAMVLFNCS